MEYYQKQNFIEHYGNQCHFEMRNWETTYNQHF